MNERGYSLLEAVGTSNHKLTFEKRIQESALMGELLEREANCHKKRPGDIKAQPPTSKPALYNQTSPTWLLTAQTH